MDRTKEFEWKVVWRDPMELIPYDRNAKVHDERQIRNIANSIKRFGWKQPGVITQDDVIVIGHGRRAAAFRLGCKMPVIVIDKKADELTDKDIRELRIADNQTNSETGYDFDLFNDDIEDLDFDGFDFDFMQEEIESVSEGAEGSLRDRYLVPPFSVIYANKPDWLARKRAWVNKGLHSEIGRGGGLVFQFPGWMARGAQ